MSNKILMRHRHLVVINGKTFKPKLFMKQNELHVNQKH